MIIPRFTLKQTDSTVTIHIRAPYSNLRDLEVTAEEEVFIFNSSPYYLRLHLPGRLEEDFTQSSFDSDNGEFTFTMGKAIQGEHFPNLDLITTLLVPKLEVQDPEDPSRKIIISTSEEQLKEDLNEEFGFALSGKKNFKHVASEFKEVFEVDPREVKLVERHKMRLQYEQGKFNVDHYLSDYIENDEVLNFIALKAPWSTLRKEEITFSDSELDFLKDLPNKHYELNEVQINYCHCCLLDVFYAYCYALRTTEFEGSCESGWTIVKLASTFCWLDVFKTPKEALVSGFRRSVIYPLYRNFDLSQRVLEDMKELLNLGEMYIIKCLIDMYNIFLKGDCCRYILNNLFIKDYIIFVMKWDQNKWREILSQTKQITIRKNDLGLNLKEIEDDVCQKLPNFTTLTINDSDDTCDSDSSSDESSSDSN